MAPTRCIFVVLIFLILRPCYEGTANLPPVFSKDIIHLVVPENTPVGKVIYTLMATDPENSTVHFNLEGTDLLRINHYTGEVVVSKLLDYETNDTLNIIVSIEDEVQGGKNNRVSVPLTVIISDENDNAPEFQKVPYEFSTNEDAEIGTTVFSKILVMDRDSTGATLEVDCLNLPGYKNSCEYFDIVSVNSSQNLYYGVIVLKKLLNYTKQQMHEFLLKSTDGHFSSTTYVTVNVGDVQNSPPRFVGILYSEIYENAAINTLVMIVHAEDGDKGVARKIAYELTNNPMNYFVLDATSGELRIASPLNREAIGNVEGKVFGSVTASELINGIKSTDPLAMTSAEIIIKVKDINDEPPSFNNREYFIEISENVSQGTILPGLNMMITDPDEGNNSAFYLQLNDISEVFAIEPKICVGSCSAAIKVANNSSLDYEDFNQRKFIILVVATELYTDPKLSSTATVTITINDINDNAPFFDQEKYSVIISEEISPGTSVISITARDKDSGFFGESGIFYQLSGSGSEKFTVDNRTGTVLVADCHCPGVSPCLDFEEKSMYNLQFMATDDEGKGQTTTVPLNVVLTDSNDNPPLFTQSLYRAYIDEDSVQFVPDLIIEAKDADKSSRIIYTIKEGNEKNVFGVDLKSGKIRILNGRGFQIGNITDNILLTVMASDGKFTATSKVNITVKDINNNSPTFAKKNYELLVAEDTQVGSSVLQLNAVDLDRGSNAAVRYYIQKGAFDAFQINNLTGVVALSSKLDFDRRNSYNIEIVARDGGEPTLTGTTILTVNVINVNDKSPYFVPTIQKVEVMENIPVGTVIHTLVALDPDVNASDALNFAATEPIRALDVHGNAVTDMSVFKHFFSIDKYSGKVLVLSHLNRDIAAIVNISVLVTDITAPTVQQGKGFLIVTISEVNDSPPVFFPPWSVELPIYKLRLKEELPIGTIVSTYKATDENSNIAGYSIVPENEYFQINNGTGIVQIKKRIDFEETEWLNFTVYAYDSGLPQLNSSAVVLVDIINLNDNSPTFLSKIYNANVSENSPNGTLVIKVEAFDADSGTYGKVVYSLAGKHSEHFTISEDCGEISVANSKFLDHEVINELTILVVANDEAPQNIRHSATVPVNIRILDINDNSPKFSKNEYHVSVVENVRLNPPIPLLQVHATDKDSGINGSIYYRIISGNYNDVFLIGLETGILFPHKSLLKQKKNFHLIIEARDEQGQGPNFDRAAVNVCVLNVNEHKPKFIEPSLPNSTVEIAKENVFANFLVMTVKATDEDKNDNAKLTYHLKINGKSQQESDEFYIDQYTGELRTKITLDRNVISKYELLLVVTDNGYPSSLDAERFLTVALVDPCENLPQFSSTGTAKYYFSVGENEKIGTKIGQVTASNMNDKSGSKVYYYLLDGSDNHFFFVNKLDGVLYSNKSFDREEADEYNLLIFASNSPEFNLTNSEKDAIKNKELGHIKNTAEIIVTITDINDNSPVFHNSTHYAAVNELVSLNYFVANVSAFDPDLGINGSFTYIIKASYLYKTRSSKSSGAVIPSPFSITQQGVISTASYLTEYNQHRFVIDVVAKENAYPQRETHTEVFVWIFEVEQLIKIILSRPINEVAREQTEIITELSNATESFVIVDDIQYHVDPSGNINKEWSDMNILVVNRLNKMILPVHDVLRIIDAKYDFLKDYYAGFAIENVAPAFIMYNEEIVDTALAALIALLIVLFVGIVTFITVCCCLRHWVITSMDLKNKEVLIKKAVIDELNTTENPLWLEHKLKIYEEQELTMQVFNESEVMAVERRNSDDLISADNTYATIQHPNRSSVHINASGSLMDDLVDYATLSKYINKADSSRSSLQDIPKYYQAAMGFQGSTFQVPQIRNNDLTGQI